MLYNAASHLCSKILQRFALYTNCINGKSQPSLKCNEVNVHWFGNQYSTHSCAFTKNYCYTLTVTIGDRAHPLNLSNNQRKSLFGLALWAQGRPLLFQKFKSCSKAKNISIGSEIKYFLQSSLYATLRWIYWMVAPTQASRYSPPF